MRSLSRVIAAMCGTEELSHFQKWAGGNIRFLQALGATAADPGKPLIDALQAVMTLFSVWILDRGFDVVAPSVPVLKRALKVPDMFGAAIAVIENISMPLANLGQGFRNFGSDTLAAHGIVDDIAAAIAAAIAVNGAADIEATGVAWRVLG
uniref:Uncharacterized protein n=1 Tax=Neobodo designis TaxID=312471 RepID=A0A7S1M248_NEODS|mmetsp:Transcript_32869/g.101588  ORF Transcript_32869/g.101588 Transcript_32869/m.101588 type:complete len:151 (+) Transcript_32869:917-1369(+)